MNLIGLDNQIREIKEFLISWNKGSSLLLIGAPGTGKTASIKYVCEELKYNIWEIDSNDLDVNELARKSKMKPLTNILIAIDNIDELSASAQTTLAKIIKESNIPIILTAHKQYTITKALMDVSKPVYYGKPRASDLLSVANELAKQLNLKPNYEALKGDYMQAILSVYGSQGYESEESIMQIIKNYFNTLKIEEINDKILITILDNSHKHYGFYTYLLVKALSIADITKRPEPLKIKELAYNGQISTSYFFEKLKLSS